MDKTFLFAKVDIPPIPEWLIDYCYSLINETKSTKIELDTRSLSWAKEFIHRDVTGIYISISPVGIDKTEPHVSSTQNFTLIYLLKHGGFDHHTVFYRPTDISQIQVDSKYKVTSNIEEITRIQIPLQNWTLINSKVLHGVEHILDERISICVRLDSIPAEFILKNIIEIEP